MQDKLRRKEQKKKKIQRAEQMSIQAMCQLYTSQKKLVKNATLRVQQKKNREL